MLSYPVCVLNRPTKKSILIGSIFESALQVVATTQDSYCDQPLGPSSMYWSGPVFWMGEKRVTSSQKWVMSPILWKGTSMWGAGLLGFPTF